MLALPRPDSALHFFLPPDKSLVSIHFFGTPFANRCSTTNLICFPWTCTSIPAAFPGNGATVRRYKYRNATIKGAGTY